MRVPRVVMAAAMGSRRPQPRSKVRFALTFLIMSSVIGTAMGGFATTASAVVNATAIVSS